MKAFLEKARISYLNRRLILQGKLNNFDPNEALLIFSDPRGGSTWITEALRRIPRTAVIWEPLHIHKVEIFRELGFGMRQHIPEDAEWPEARHAFDQLLRGRILNGFIGTHSDRKEFAQAEHLLVKFVRGNSLIPWLTRQFDFRHPPVFLVRHPLAVVASQAIYFEFDVSHDRWNLFDPEKPFGEIYRPHTDFLGSLKTMEEVLLAQWCITTLPTLRDPANNRRWLTINYETLLLDPTRVVERIFEAWNMPVPPGTQAQLQQASSTTNEATFLEGKEVQLRKWQDQFNDEQIQRLKAVLDYFEVEFYDEGVKPLIAF